MQKVDVKKLVLAGVLVAVGVVCSPLNIPIGASKCFPVQHMVNVLAAVLLGRWYGVGMAFLTSLIRVIIGTGSLLAFPGSMCGALICGLLFDKSHNLLLTYFGEVVGTGIVGGLLAYPMATLFMAKEAALFAYVVPFLISTVGGTLIAALLIAAFKKTKVMEQFTGHRV